MLILLDLLHWIGRWPITHSVNLVKFHFKKLWSNFYTVELSFKVKLDLISWLPDPLTNTYSESIMPDPCRGIYIYLLSNFIAHAYYRKQKRPGCLLLFSIVSVNKFANRFIPLTWIRHYSESFLKFRFSKKATKFETISHMIC